MHISQDFRYSDQEKSISKDQGQNIPKHEKVPTSQFFFVRDVLSENQLKGVNYGLKRSVHF